VARIIVTPFLIWAMVVGYWGYAFLLFFFAVITDFLDGFLARLLQQKTFLGACLDPIADKLLLISSFLTLAYVETPLLHIPTWFVICVFCKEVLQLVGAFFVYYGTGQYDVKATLLGKCTAVMQMSFIMLLILCYLLEWHMSVCVYRAILSVLVFFIGISFVQYMTIGMRMLRVRS
jgi:cardiolipin synthase